MRLLTLSLIYGHPQAPDLHVALSVGDFFGRTHCRVDTRAFARAAQNFADLPVLAAKPPTLEFRGPATEADSVGLLRFHVSAQPLDARGVIELKFALARPVDPRSDGEQSNMACSMPVGHEQLRLLANCFDAFAKGSVGPVTLNLDRDRDPPPVLAPRPRWDAFW